MAVKPTTPISPQTPPTSSAPHRPAARTGAPPLTGPQKALRKLGLRRDIDLALHIPLRYEDETRLTTLLAAREGDAVQIEATVLECDVQLHGKRQLLVTVDDGSDRCVLRFFSFYPAQQKAFAVGSRWRIRGELRGGFLGWTMMHPVCKPADGALPTTLTPVYPTVAGLPQNYLRRAVHSGLNRADLSETLPDDAEDATALNPSPSTHSGNASDFSDSSDKNSDQNGLQRLWGLRESLQFLHYPTSDATPESLQDRNHPAWQRLKAEELLAQQLSQLQARREHEHLRAPQLRPAQEWQQPSLQREGKAPPSGRRSLSDELLAVLPFGLTGAQRRVVDEITRDLARPAAPATAALTSPVPPSTAAAPMRVAEPRPPDGLPDVFSEGFSVDLPDMTGIPMNRLLQGDVGSGKTVVAALAAAICIDAGWQCALMVPTEILAQQHFAKLVGWLEPLLAPRGQRVAWLTGSLGKKKRKEMLALIESGEAALVVGTHAVIQTQVRFHRLALAIIDEQHRFGVQQRLALREKMQNRPLAHTLPAQEATYFVANTALEPPALQQEPHLLMMTATPIPRTLAMSYYADLDVSTLDELPPGRTPVVTKLVAEHRRDQVVERIRAQIAQGRQVYWVCPLIEESEHIDLINATATHQALCSALPGVLVGLLHSRMSSAEKQAVMALFTGGLMGVLVSTTVIEVGVDVPNASLMVIEHAERFGLSQLHQLRGRVGRGAAASACVLLYSNGEHGRLSETAKARLKAMAQTSDGFEIARRDLDIRGPGEFLGARQSGAPLLRFADLATDTALLEWARALAPRLLDRHPELAQRHVDRWLGGKSDYLLA